MTARGRVGWSPSAPHTLLGDGLRTAPLRSVTVGRAETRRGGGGPLRAIVGPPTAAERQPVVGCQGSQEYETRGSVGYPTSCAGCGYVAPSQGSHSHASFPFAYLKANALKADTWECLGVPARQPTSVFQRFLPASRLRKIISEPSLLGLVIINESEAADQCGVPCARWQIRVRPMWCEQIQSRSCERVRSRQSLLVRRSGGVLVHGRPARLLHFDPPTNPLSALGAEREYALCGMCMRCVRHVFSLGCGVWLRGPFPRVA